MREIEEAAQNSRTLTDLLSSHRELPTMLEDDHFELAVRKSLVKLVIMCVPMPPRMQAMHMQELLLSAQLQFRRLQKAPEEAIVRIELQLAVVRRYQKDWLDAELGKISTMLSELKDYEFGVGMNWTMLVIVDVPKLIEDMRTEKIEKGK